MVTGKYSKIMSGFTEKNIPNLDVATLGALELFQKKKLPKISLPKHKRLLVLGSGNALDTGKIIFEDNDAVFESESTYKKRLSKVKFDLAVLISASGSKHAPIIAKYLRSKKIKTILLTNTKNSQAEKFVSKSYVFPKQREPYTYNTSTYMSLILSKSKENPKSIMNHLKKIKVPKNLKKYEAFYLIVPEEFDAIRQMLVTKFDELFGPKITGRVYTKEETKHAKTLVQSKKELFISFGEKNNTFGKNRLNIPLPKKAGYGAMMATAYYVIGKIQAQDESFFKKNVVRYTKKASKIFKSKIGPIVE